MLPREVAGSAFLNAPEPGQDELMGSVWGKRGGTGDPLIYEVYD